MRAPLLTGARRPTAARSCPIGRRVRSTRPRRADQGRRRDPVPNEAQDPPSVMDTMFSNRFVEKEDDILFNNPLAAVSRHESTRDLWLKTYQKYLALFTRPFTRQHRRLDRTGDVGPPQPPVRYSKQFGVEPCDMPGAEPRPRSPATRPAPSLSTIVSEWASETRAAYVLREQERVAVPSTMTNPIRLHVDSTCHTAAQLSTGPRKRDALTRLIQNLLGRRQATRGVSVDMTDPARPSSSSEAAPRREYKPVGNPFARETLSHAGRHGWRCGRDNDATVDIIEHEADILTLSRDMFRVGQVTGTLPNQPLRADLRCRANGTAHAQRAISKADVNDGLTICAPITSRKDDTTGGCTYAPTMLDETGPLYRRLRMPRKSVSGITGDDLVDAGRQAGGIRGGQRATNVKRFPPKAVGSGLIRGPAKQSDVTTVGNPSPTSLTRAIRNGSIADVRRNVQAGVTWRCAHVRLASRGGHLAIVQYLVAQIKDESVRRKVIQVAIEAAQDERVRSLLIKHNRSRHIE